MKVKNKGLWLLAFGVFVGGQHEALAKSKSKNHSKKGETKDDSQSVAVTSDMPFSKAGGVNSVESKLHFGNALSSTNNAELLGVDAPRRVTGGKTSVVKTVDVEDGKRRSFKNLNIGLFRNEQLTNGYVSPPGVADFAAYFRGAAHKADAQNNGQSAPSPSAATADTRTILGSASADDLAKGAEAESLRLQTVESIQQILKTKPSPDQRFTLMMRLAEIQVERHAYLLETEIKKFNDEHDAWKKSGKGSEPVFRTDKSNSQLISGIEVLRTLATQFPNHPRADEVLFDLGFLLTQMQNDSAVLYFDRLIKRFPKSEYIPDTYLALGEHYFAKENFNKALSNYQKVLAYKGTSAYNYSVYKLGWTYFNLRSRGEKDTEKNLSKSLSAFRLVVKLAETTQDPVLKDLRSQALKDMVLVFADMNDIDNAQKYYESLGEPELYHTLLERLAWQHSERGNYDKAVSIYERLIAETPTNPRLPSIYAKVPELLEKQHKRGKLLQFLNGMSTALAADGKWAQANRAQKDVMADRDRILAKELLAWAQKFHSEAQKSGHERTYDEALVAYSIYLDNFGETAQAYTAHFFKAEIFVQKGKYVEASDEYMRAVAIDEKFNLNGKYTRDALLNSIQCVDMVLAKTPPIKLAEAGRAPQKIPLTALHERLVKSLDGFVRHFPTDDDTLKLAHRAASIVYAFGDYVNADMRWTALAQKYPRSPEVFEGARLMVKVPVMKQDWTFAILECRKFLGIKGVKDSRLGAELTVVLKGSMFQKALVLEKSDKRAEAADLFMAYHKEFQDDAEAPKALFNAANNQFRIGKVDEALSALRIVLAQYPGSNLAPHALYLIATSYDALGEFANSAANFEQLANDVPKSPVTAEALLRASQHRLAIGDSMQAIKDAGTLVEKHPRSDMVPDAYLVMGRAYHRMNNHKEAARTFVRGAETVAASYPKYAVLLYGLAADANYNAGELGAAEQNCVQAERLIASMNEKAKDANVQEGIRLVGTVEVSMLDRKLPALYKHGITNSGQLNQQFAKIRGEVQELAARYVSVVKMGNAEAGIGALYRIAEMQEFLGTVLLKAPAPANSKPEEVETFRSSLEQVAFPLQEEATNLYVTAWQKANETEAMTPFTKKLYDKLVVLKPAEFKPIVEDMPAPSYFTSEVAVAPETKGLSKE